MAPRKFLSLLWLIILLLTLYLLVEQQKILLLLFAFGSSFAYYSLEFIHKNSTNALTFAFSLLRRQLPHQLVYAVWLINSQQKTLLYFLPFTLSTAGKLFLLFAGHFKKNNLKNRNLATVQDLVLLQTLSQLAIVAFYLLEVISGSFHKLSGLVFLAVAFKVKQGTNWNCRFSLYRLNQLFKSQVIRKGKLLQGYQLLEIRLAPLFGPLCDELLQFY